MSSLGGGGELSGRVGIWILQRSIQEGEGEQKRQKERRENTVSLCVHVIPPYPPPLYLTKVLSKLMKGLRFRSAWS